MSHPLAHHRLKNFPLLLTKIHTVALACEFLYHLPLTYFSDIITCYLLLCCFSHNRLEVLCRFFTYESFYLVFFLPRSCFLPIFMWLFTSVPLNVAFSEKPSLTPTSYSPLLSPFSIPLHCFSFPSSHCQPLTLYYTLFAYCLSVGWPLRPHEDNAFTILLWMLYSQAFLFFKKELLSEYLLRNEWKKYARHITKIKAVQQNFQWWWK